MQKTLKLILVLISLTTMVSSVFAEDFKVKALLRPKMTTDFVTNKTGIDFDTSGLLIQKNFGDNFSAVFQPGFIRQSFFNTVPAGSNDVLAFLLIEGFFEVTDVTKGYADLGIGLKAGQFILPFYSMEQYYQPFRFIYKPLDYKMMANNFSDLGVMAQTSFLDGVIKLNFGYVNGSGVFSNETSINTSNDNPNAGALLLTTTFAPFKNSEDIIKELSLTVNLKSVLKATARSNYNFLLGYKYSSFATAIEYLKTYSSLRSKDITAFSVSTSYDVYGPFQALARWDYSDNNSATTHLDHFFLLGMNTKWYQGKLQVALTYDQEYDPSRKTIPAKRLMLATQFYY